MFPASDFNEDEIVIIILGECINISIISAVSPGQSYIQLYPHFISFRS